MQFTPWRAAIWVSNWFVILIPPDVNHTAGARNSGTGEVSVGLLPGLPIGEWVLFRSASITLP